MFIISNVNCHFIGYRSVWSRSLEDCIASLVGWLVTGAPTFVIWHHSLIHIRDLAPLINIALVLVSSAKVKAGRCGVQSNQRVLPI